MMDGGWISEGVAMCVAGDSVNCKVDLSFATPPGAPPGGIVATGGNANVTVDFKPPASDGGLPITSYTATCTAPGVLKTATNTMIQPVILMLTIMWLTTGRHFFIPAVLRIRSALIYSLTSIRKWDARSALPWPIYVLPTTQKSGATISLMGLP